MSKASTKPSTSVGQTDVFSSFWHSRRFLLAFFAAALGLSFVVPWLEIQGKSMSGLSVLLNWSTANPVLHTAFWHPLSLVGIALLVIFSAVLAVLGFRSVSTSRKVTLALIWVLALFSTWPAAVIFLNSQSDNVKQVVYILGYWLTLFGSASLFIYSLILMAHIDASEQRPTGWLEIVLPVMFVLISVIGTLINYKWINYELVPPATKIIRSVKSSR